MSMLGELTYFLGLQISQQDNRIFTYQTKYIKEILKKNPDGRLQSNPYPHDNRLQVKLKDVYQRLYRSIIGSLLYVIASRPNVMQAVGKVARFQAAPKECHIISIKIILRFLRGTSEYGLWYPKRNDLIIQAYTGVDWAGSVDDRKNTSGETFYLGGCLVSWLGKNKSLISLSIA